MGPAGRGSCAEGGHFVTRVPFPGNLNLAGPPDGRKLIAEQREARHRHSTHKGTQVTK
jgi:hypothetical protein